MLSKCLVALNENYSFNKKNETIVKYSVLEGSQQLFASKYQLYLPTEEELRMELEREKRLIESEKSFQRNE